MTFSTDASGRTASGRPDPAAPGSPAEALPEREWWVESWLDLLNSYRFKKRLERARNYARQGNVLSIEFKGTKAIARVQGTEAEPYRVSLWLDPFSNEDWDGVVQTLCDRSIFAAKLLAGEMPADIQDAFAANGLSLFPFSLGEVRSKCSCPDKANPCKHVGAVYYLLGDRFSEDPFVLFQLRGRTQEELLAAMREKRAERARGDRPAELADAPPLPESVAAIADATEDGAISGEAAAEAAAEAAELADPSQFWAYDEPLEPALVVIAPPPDNNTPLDLLGPISLPADATGNPGDRQTANRATMQYLDEIYRTASQQAIVRGLG